MLSIALSKKTFGIENEDLMETCLLVVVRMFYIGLVLLVIDSFYISFLAYQSTGLVPDYSMKLLAYYFGYLYLSLLLVGVTNSSVKVWKYLPVPAIFYNFYLLMYVFYPWLTEYHRDAEKDGMYKITVLFQYFSLPVFLMFSTFYSVLAWKIDRISSDYEPCEVIYGGEDSSMKKLIKNL